MKFYPILYSPEMSKAILEGRKNVTRRTVKINNHDEVVEFIKIVDEDKFYVEWDSMDNDIKHCPYGKPGDVLWVREEHYAYGIWVKDGKTKTGKQKWKFKRTGGVYFNYITPDEFKFYKSLAAHSRDNKKPDHPSFYKRLGRFMPKDICRIFLQIKSIRVERLQDINEADAKAEGVSIDKAGFYKDYLGAYKVNPYANPYYSFKTLWKLINGMESWDANPWVWVIEFQRIEKPSSFLP
jgi:hypothetical protein